MSQTQYLKMLEREIQKINKVIDYKIIHGEEYTREARDHKLMLRKVRYHSKAKKNLLGFFRKLFQIQSFQF